MLRFVGLLCGPLALVCGAMLVAGMLAGRSQPPEAVFVVAIDPARAPQRSVNVLRLVESRTAASVEVTRHFAERSNLPVVIPSDVPYHVQAFWLTGAVAEFALIDLRDGARSPGRPRLPSPVVAVSTDRRHLLIHREGQLALSRAGPFSAYLPHTQSLAWLSAVAVPLSDASGEPLRAASDPEALFLPDGDLEALFLPDGGLLVYSAGALHAFDLAEPSRSRFRLRLDEGAAEANPARRLLAYIEAEQRLLVRIADRLHFVDFITGDLTGPLVTDLNGRGLFSRSPNGRQMIVGTNTGFVLLDLHTGISETLVIGEPQIIHWSPDGGRVALAYRPDTMTGAIWLTVVRLGDHAGTMLTENNQLALAWSADGRYLAYSEGLAAQPISLCVHDVVRAATTCEDTLPPLSILAWEQKRNLLYVAQPFQSVTTGGDGRLYVYDPATQQARALTPTGEAVRSFSVMRWGDG